MNITNFYIKGGFENTNLKNLAKCKPFCACSTAEDFIKRGRALLVKGDRSDYFDAFICFNTAIVLDFDNFEAYIGSYKSYYMYSSLCHHEGWDLSIDDRFRDVIFHAPKEYKDALGLMFEEDKKKYPEKAGRYAE